MQIVETVAPEQESSTPVFHKVGENLYRHVPSGNYYALLKRGGKQFRRSLKTTDRALAQRRLSALRDQVNNLTLTAEKNATFADLAKAWIETQTHALKPSSLTGLLELRETLQNPKFAQRLAATSETAESLTERLRAACHEAVPARITLPAELRDPDDVHVLACAVSAGADAIVTGDKDLLTMGTFQGIPIVDATEVLKRLGLS